MPKRSKAKSKDKLNIKKSEKGRRAAPPKRLKIPVSIPALEAAATKAAEFAAKHEAAAAESKGAAQQRRSDADAARQEVAKLEAAAKKARLDATKSVAAVKEENNRAAKLDALVPPRRWRLLQRKQPTSPPNTKPPQRSQRHRGGTSF